MNVTLSPTEEIKKPTFSFKDIVILDDRAIQRVLREVDCQELSKALKSVDSTVQEKIFNNMSERAAKMLKEDMVYIGPIRFKDVEEAQLKIGSIIKHLRDIGEITLDMEFSESIVDYEVRQRILRLSETPLHSNRFDSIDDFELYLTNIQSEPSYGLFQENVMRCSFFNSKKGEKTLAEIERKNEEQGMGNIKIPNTKIKLINYSICPECNTIFSFKELADYYANPKPDPAFPNRVDQFRQDTRVCCPECGTYFLPSLIISDSTPRKEVQFLCTIQTVNAIEQYFLGKGMQVLTKNKKNVLHKGGRKAIRNDILLKRLELKPTLITNLLQHTPANLIPNLIDGSNVEKRDVLYGAWERVG
ncbi:hypothetical protein FACS1894137_12200 [Spirochaetia bacterium]|nr:hypothetical protein FACS1894137_12200 [Spirochaetia bacterium]